MSLFNFAYYREHGGPGRGPFNEPPFHVLKRLSDREWLARQPQWYSFLPLAPNAAQRTALNLFSSQPDFAPGQTLNWAMDVAPAGPRQQAIFRLRMSDRGGRRWAAKINGTSLSPVEYVAKPIPHPYESALGEAVEYASFRFPPRILRNGLNDIAITLEDDNPTKLEYMELFLL